MKLLAIEQAELQIEVLHSSNVLEEALAQGILEHVDLDEVLEEPFSDGAHNEGLAHLPRAVHEQGTIDAGCEMLCYLIFDFSLQHGVSNDFSI